MTQPSSDMAQLTAGLPTKSEKIRVLNRAGFSRSEIANFLQIRYQHVRNVLKDEERIQARQEKSGAATGMAEADRGFVHAEPLSGTGACRITVGPKGEVKLPEGILEAAGVRPGDSLLVRFADDEIKLVTPEATARKVRAVVREFVSEGVSLVEELLTERRREAAGEQGHS